MKEPARVTILEHFVPQVLDPEGKSVSSVASEQKISWNFLIRILKWPCALAQFGGYWPFQLVDGTEWQFKWKSFQGAQVVLMPLIALISTMGVWANAIMLFKHLSDGVSETERLGHGITSTISQVGVVVLMISTILNRNGIATTWNALNRLCNETASLTESDSDLGKMAQLKFQKWISFRKWGALLGTTFVFLEAAINVMLAFTEVMPKMFALYGYNQATLTAAAFLTCWLIVFRLYMTLVPILLATLSVIAGIYRHLAFQLSVLGGDSLEQRFDQIAFVKSPKALYNDGLSTLIENLLKIGDELEKVMDKLNHKLKTQMLVILMILGMGLIFNAFTIVVNFEKGLFRESGKRNTGELFCFVIDAVMFSVICSSASAVTHKAQSFGDELGKLVSTSSLSPGFISRIQHAACKFSLKPPVFSPGYYFVVNNQLLTSLVAMVATYLTVLLQFSGSSSNPDNSTNCPLTNQSKVEP